MFKDSGKPRESVAIVEPRVVASDVNTPSFYRSLDAREEEPMQVRHYLGVLRKHMLLVLAIVAVITVPVTYVLSSTPDYYVASTRVEIDPEKSAPIDDRAKPYATTISEDPTYLTTQLQIMSSPAVLRPVVQSLNLGDNRAFRRYLMKRSGLLRRLFRMPYYGKSSWESYQGQVPLTESLSPELSNADFIAATRLEMYVSDLQHRLTIEPVRESRTLVRETRLIDIKFVYPVAELAAQIANAVADSYVLFSRQDISKEAEIESKNLTQRMVGLQNEIREAESRLVQYAKAHRIISLQPGENIAIDRLINLNRDLVQAENDRKIAEANYRTALDPIAGNALGEDSATEEISIAEQQLASLRQKRAQLLVTTTEKWPEVREISQEIASLESHLRSIRTRAKDVTVTILKVKYDQALGREAAMRKVFEQERQVNETQNQASVEYRLMQQGIDTRKKILDALLERIGKNAVSLATTVSNARVIDYALVPDTANPAGPLRLPYILVALLVSLIIGGFVALFKEHLNDTFTSSQDVKAAFRLPALCVTSADPTIWGTFVSRLIGQRNRGPFELPASAMAKSLVAEDFRRLRTFVFLSNQREAPKRLLVTSSVPGEGKTTTAINTAVSLAQTGAKVLIIDADMRRPRVHSVFQVSNSEGLSTILSEDTPDQELMQYVTEVSRGLYVLPAGPNPSNPSELLGSEGMRRVTAALGDRFSHLIVDSPSIGSAVDSLVLSRWADGVLLVVHAGKIGREMVRESLEQLSSSGAELRAIVLNNVDAKNHSKYYGYAPVHSDTNHV